MQQPMNENWLAGATGVSVPVQRPNHEELSELRVMWILVSTLFLVWTVLMVVQHLFRSVALWKMSKMHHAGYTGLETSSAEPTGPPSDTRGAHAGGLTRELGESEWFLRFRHAAKIARDNTIMLLLATLLTQLLLFPPVPRNEHYREDAGALGCDWDDPDCRDDTNRGVGEWSRVYLPYVFVILLFALAALQLLVHGVLEPMFRKPSTSRGGGYLYYAPGIYGGRQEIAAKWLDPIVDLTRSVLLVILVVTTWARM